MHETPISFRADRRALAELCRQRRMTQSELLRALLDQESKRIQRENHKDGSDSGQVSTNQPAITA